MGGGGLAATVVGVVAYSKLIRGRQMTAVQCKESDGGGLTAKKSIVGNTNDDSKDFGEDDDGSVRANLPNFTLKEVAAHCTEEKGIWITFRNGVYDVTEFVDGHPGGREKIMLAAGRPVDAYWEVYGVHLTKEVEEILEGMRIGNLTPEDRQSKATASKKGEGPYANDPVRSPILTVNTPEPFNAETPPSLLTDNFLTPQDIFFVRNHLPVPDIDPKTHVLEVSGHGGGASKKKSIKLSLDDLKTKFPKHTIVATIQCAGNRRSELARVKPVKGLPWGSGAISTAEWSGARLRDVLIHAGFKEENFPNVEHVHLEGVDSNPLTGECYGASIPIEKAMSLKGDCILAYEMNGAPLSRDHGYPIRAIVPGTVGARNVKWLKRIATSPEEYQGFWQQRDYKGFSPSVDWNNVDFSQAPAIQELPVQSTITSHQNGSQLPLGSQEVALRGYAWSGGGRGIARIDVSADGGSTWHVASPVVGTGQHQRRAWAWTLWEVTVPIPESHRGGGELELCCKAVDVSYNVQPDTANPIWNLRGVLSNAWHRVRVKVPS